MLVTRSLLALCCLCTLAHAQVTSPADEVPSFNPKLLHAPVLIEAPAAEMPFQSGRQSDGLCAIDLIVDVKGHPQNPRVVRCTDPIFAENSLKATRNYRFKPATTIQEGKPVATRMHIFVSIRRGPGPLKQFPVPKPRIQIGFLIPSKPDPPKPDDKGTYTLSHDFDPPNSFPKLERFANAGFGSTAFLLNDGVGCVAKITLDETGAPTSVEITNCDDSALENSARQSLQESQFSPAILNGKPVPVRASVHLVCEGFGPPSVP